MAKPGSSDLSSGQLLSTSWFDSAGIPSLNQHNVLDYFSQRSNPFYDRTCNNEVIKMQRIDPAQLMKMTGIEYMLLHVQEPILYVIRKVHRQAADRVTPLADYYVLGGIVYQCPDIWSIINSRLLSTLHLVSEAFTEFLSLSRYNPNRGYYWEFPDETSPSQKTAPPRPDDPGDSQRRRVDNLLTDLLKKFPPRAFSKKDGGKPLVLGGDKKDKKVAMAEPKEAPSTGTTGPGMVVGIKRQGTTDSKIPDPKRKRT